MPKKTKLKAGDHVIGVSRRKSGDKLYATPFCRCGWRGEESQQITAALEGFDKHMERLKRGEAS